MNEAERWNFLCTLDEELLRGGVMLSEWCCFIVREADTAFAGGAHLATIITAMAGIETYLRSEYGGDTRDSLHQLIGHSPLDESLKADLQTLRNYRNKWVHVGRPWDDQELAERPEKYERELEEVAFLAVRALRLTIYENPWV